MLSSYDGSTGFLIDTNVWIDVLVQDDRFSEGAVNQLQACSQNAPINTNIIIYTELLAPGLSASVIDELLGVYSSLRLDLPSAYKKYFPKLQLLSYR